MQPTETKPLNNLDIIVNSKVGTLDSQTTSDDIRHDYDMIVFCHLRWDFVYQRPQHLISRFAGYLKILFVEEPLPRSEPDSSIRIISSNLHVLQPNIADIQDLPQVLFGFININANPIGWFYSPSFHGVLEKISFSTIVYDCMDELSLFKGASSDLISQERILLNEAKIVFTGGKSLFESKFSLHSNIHCFPSSVDIEHFSMAKNGISIPEELDDIPSPIIGYFGVLDERIDLKLIEQTASKLPDCSFIFIGPVVKIQEEELPRLPNIHYLGIRPYALLPYFLKAFDIAMMPFELNESTKYISPTKTLEYMAAGKPIISTKIRDVVRDYTSCIRLIDNSEDFAEEIRKILDKDIIPKVHLYESILKKTSWDFTVNQMKKIINESIKK
ncbi:glycosyltransferase [Pararhodonellum marinum]|uniref:glycosyltransferase n=1 Tax=Pararhodonellum marinum TaxID=2755358 RepID=UPI00189055C7|nr:glycosyltransferase [Pararhodonellum marinum]